MERVLFLMCLGEKIPADELSKRMLLEKLEKLESQDLNRAISNISLLNLKSPIIGLILGLFLGFFGIDRFYKGDIALGIVKLLVGWLTLGIWVLVDLYFVFKGIQKDNFTKILMSF